MQKLTKPWTDDDVRAIVTALDEGLSPERTSMRLKRSVKSIQSMARKMGRKFKTMKERRRDTYSAVNTAPK